MGRPMSHGWPSGAVNEPFTRLTGRSQSYALRSTASRATPVPERSSPEAASDGVCPRRSLRTYLSNSVPEKSRRNYPSLPYFFFLDGEDRRDSIRATGFFDAYAPWTICGLSLFC